MKSFRRIQAILIKEFRQLRRDRLTFGMIVGIPLVQILLFGYAINTDVRHLDAAVFDASQTALSREFIQAMEVTQVVRWSEPAHSREALDRRLRRGEISAGFVIPHDFIERLGDPSRSAAQVLADASDPIVLSAINRLEAMPFSIGGAPRFSPAVPLINVQPKYNPEGRSAVNTVPGLVGIILTMTMVLFTALAIVRERERGNMEMLITTPVRSVELMVGKILPYILIGLVQTSLVLFIGVWLFHVPILGSIWHVFGGALVFIVANLTLGLLISTLASNQFQAMQMTFFYFLPSILLSGFMFPFEGMPELAQYIGEALPLTHFIRIVRAILLRGAELSELSLDLIALVLFNLVCLVLALTRFRKRLD